MITPAQTPARPFRLQFFAVAEVMRGRGWMPINEIAGTLPAYSRGEVRLVLMSLVTKTLVRRRFAKGPRGGKPRNNRREYLLSPRWGVR